MVVKDLLTVPRISIAPSGNGLLSVLRRRQLSIELAFAMTFS